MVHNDCRDDRLEAEFTQACMDAGALDEAMPVNDDCRVDPLAVECALAGLNAYGLDEVMPRVLEELTGPQLTVLQECGCVDDAYRWVSGGTLPDHALAMLAGTVRDEHFAQELDNLAYDQWIVRIPGGSRGVLVDGHDVARLRVLVSRGREGLAELAELVPRIEDESRTLADVAAYDPLVAAYWVHACPQQDKEKRIKNIVWAAGGLDIVTDLTRQHCPKRVWAPDNGTVSLDKILDSLLAVSDPSRTPWRHVTSFIRDLTAHTKPGLLDKYNMGSVEQCLPGNMVVSAREWDQLCRALACPERLGRIAARIFGRVPDDPHDTTNNPVPADMVAAD